MFVILLNYIQNLETVNLQLAGHRLFLDECYQKGFFIASGPKKPRSGGVLISQLNDKAKLEKILASDPFYKNNIATYEIIEFEPTKYHKDFINFI